MNLYRNFYRSDHSEGCALKSTMKSLQYKEILDLMLEGIQIIDFNWRYVYVNEALIKISKYSREELLGFSMMEKYPGIEQTPLFKTLQRCMQERTSDFIENEFVFPDGTKGLFELKIQPVESGICIQSIDRTIKAKTELALIKSNRLYEILSAINQSIIHIDNKQELFERVCEIATNTGGFLLAWVVELDEKKMLRLSCMKGHQRAIDEAQKNFNSGLVVSIDDPMLKGTPTGRALLSKRPVVINNVADEREQGTWKDSIKRANASSTVVLPLIKFGDAVGSIGFLSNIENFFDEKETVLLEELAKDVSFALENYHRIESHKKTEARILENEKRFRALIEKSADMKILETDEGELIYASPSVTTFLGYDTSEIRFKSVFDFIHPDDRILYRNIRDTILKNAGESASFQHRRLHKNNKWIWCEGKITNLLHDENITAFVTNFRDISKIIALERQREFDRKNMNALINSTKDLMWSVDRKYKLITTNQAFIELMTQTVGLPREGDSILSKSLSEEQALRFKESYDSVFNGQSIVKIEHNQGSKFEWMEIFFSPIRKGERIIGAAGYSRDITERVKTAETLAANERRFRSMIENGSDCVAILGADGGITYVSPSITSILGYTVEEVKFLNLFELIHPDDLDNISAKMKEVLDSPGISKPGYTARTKHKDGSWRWLEATITNWLHDPAINGIVDNFRDVTEKKRIEDELVRSDAFTKGVLNSLSAHIAVVNESGTILAVNDAWRNFESANIGVKPASTGVGSNYFDVCENAAKEDPSVLDMLKGMKDVLYEKVETFYTEYPCDTPDQKLWFAMLVRKIKGGEPQIVIAHQDISKRKFAEEELINKNKELQKTNVELDRFVYSTSHDLRSPLTTILGLLSIIDRESKEPAMLEYAAMIRTSTKRLDEFVRNIINYSKNNRAELELSHTLVKRAIEEVIERAHLILDLHDLNIEVDIDQPVDFCTDVQRFQIIMENLIINAIKFQDPKKTNRYIRISGTCDVNNLVLQIEDNGVGIPEKYRQKIFTMFFRLSNPKAGPGIGLYVVKETVDKLKGTIELSSIEKEGSTFTLKLRNFSNDLTH
jgi:PAS domain S-box-containing protein